MSNNCQVVLEMIEDLKSTFPSTVRLSRVIGTILPIIEKDETLDPEIKSLAIEECKKLISQSPLSNEKRGKNEAILEKYRGELSKMSLSQLRYESRYRFSGNREKITLALLREKKSQLSM